MKRVELAAYVGYVPAIAVLGEGYERRSRSEWFSGLGGFGRAPVVAAAVAVLRTITDPAVRTPLHAFAAGLEAGEGHEALEALVERLRPAFDPPPGAYYNPTGTGDLDSGGAVYDREIARQLMHEACAGFPAAVRADQGYGQALGTCVGCLRRRYSSLPAVELAQRAVLEWLGLPADAKSIREVTR